MNKQTKHCFPAMIPKVVKPGNLFLSKKSTTLWKQKIAENILLSGAGCIKSD
jgi:hypothetical protein